MHRLAASLVHAALPCLAVAMLRATAAGAQVSGETRLDANGYGVTMVHNASPDLISVQVELRHGSVSAAGIFLDHPAEALVSPTRFTLGPGESQTVRLLVRESLPADSVLRLVTTLTPIEPQPPASADTTVGGAVARFTYATRLVTKVLAR